MLGDLKDEAEPTIRHYTDMANIMGKEKAIGDLTGDNKKVKDDPDGIVAQKGVEFVQIQSKLASDTKAREFLVDVSKLGQVTRISTAGATGDGPQCHCYQYPYHFLIKQTGG